MSEEPRPKQFINIEGPLGESVFRRLLKWLLPPDKQRELQKEVNEYLAHYKGLADERAMVIACALCVEDSLNEMIKTFFPKSRDRLEKRGSSFSFKIEIVRACKIIPSRILGDCDLICKLRNDFAHQLKLKTLSEWDDKNFVKVDEAIKGYQRDYDFGVSRRQRFEDLVAFVGIALKAYTTHMQIMRRFIDTEDFMKSLKDFVQKENVS